MVLIKHLVGKQALFQLIRYAKKENKIKKNSQKETYNKRFSEETLGGLPVENSGEFLKPVIVGIQ